jgi:hypothetical protein
MTGNPDGPVDLDARAASTWVSATGVAWAVVPLVAAALFLVDAAAGHLAAGICAVVVLVLGLGVVLLRRRTPAGR